MKKLFPLLTAALFAAQVWAQTPQKLSYQAVVRTADNQLAANKRVGMQISIVQGSVYGASVYVETQTPTANANGLVSIEIGAGEVKNGTFAAIDWSKGPYFIKTETDPTGGSSYSVLGISQLLSVPYSLYAQKAGEVVLTDAQKAALKGDKGEAGTQTIIKAGANVSVTGTGTDTSPYVVAATSSGGTGSALQQFTQAQIDALTPQAGMLVYNTDYKILQFYDGTQWSGSPNSGCVPKPNYANAGRDSGRVGSSLNLYANSPVAGVKGYWEITSGAGGTIAEPTNPKSSFTGQIGTLYKLNWSHYSNCDTLTDNVKIAFVESKTVTTGTVADIDGNTYKTITYNGQTWFAENLKTSKYNDGTDIPNITDGVAWGALTTGA